MAPTCSAGPRWVCNADGRGGSTHRFFVLCDSPHPPAAYAAGPSLPRLRGRVIGQLPPPQAGEGWGGGSRGLRHFEWWEPFLNILLCGDVVGRSGRDAIKTHLPELKRDLAIDLAIVNAENAAHGFGLTERLAGEM